MDKKARYTATRLLGLAGISTLFAGFMAVFGQSATPKEPYSTWSDFGGAIDSMQYSSLRQISKKDVSKLELAWTYLTPGRGGSYPFSPLIVDDVVRARRWPRHCCARRHHGKTDLVASSGRNPHLSGLQDVFALPNSD